jgi:protoheme IX farnesyltransferase
MHMTAATSVSSPVSLGYRVSRVARAYVVLTKPRIIELLLVTTVPSMLLAAGSTARDLPGAWLIAGTLLFGTLAAGSANALNCYLDRDIDAIMHRTHNRPLHRHEISSGHALVFGIALGALSVTGFAIFTNALAAVLAAAAIAFYVGVYTALLKRRTSANIVWGGAAGCMPVVIGWAAVTGSVGWGALVLFGVVFLWTPPHFWALSLYRSDDYRRAGVPMLPVVAGPRETKRQMLIYTLILLPMALAPTLLGAVGWIYGAIAAVMSAAFIGHAVAVWRTADDETAHPVARRMFFFSLLYLAVLFAALPVDRFVARMIGG